MTSRILKTLAVLATTALLTACKVEVVAVEGGDIAWSGGSCSGGSNCVVEITDPNFSKTFTVTPKPGYEFVKWRKGTGFHCGDSKNLACEVTVPGDAAAKEAIVATFTTTYLMPVYEDVGVDFDGDGIRNELDEDDDNDGILDEDDICPLDSDCGSPTIVLEGREWFQPAVFKGIGFDRIATACPDGNCDGLLGEFNMTGWTWATFNEVNTYIFQHYYDAADQFWCDKIFAPVGPLVALYSGELITSSLAGWVLPTDTTIGDYWGAAVSRTAPGFPPCLLDGPRISSGGLPTIVRTGVWGGWFYRTP